MYKVFAAIAVAAMLSGAAVVVSGLTTRVEASTPKMGVKGDRLDYRPTGTACSQRGWPYFETECLRNVASPTRHAKAVRLVTTDRLTYDWPAIDRSLAMR
jgi:hypothetical protein